MRLFTITFAAAFFSVSSWADQQSIEEFERSCLARGNGVTSDQVNCTRQTHALWEQEMNENYRKLMFVLPQNKRLALREAQRKWIVFRDQELKNIATFYSDIDGTMYRVTRHQNEMSLTKNRSEELSGFLLIYDMTK
jgi:uncharacterized protein YecT (DUF1311 family)